MKKVLIVLSLIAICLCGCKSNKEPVVLPETGSYNTQGEKAVVYHDKERSFPLSFTVDGVQQIQNGVYWYYELADAYERNWEDSFYTYNTKNLELNGNVGYSELEKKNCYATNGDWPLFLSPVHTEYSASNQDQVDAGLMKLVQQQLSQQQLEGASAMITDTWFCDLDGDQNREILFKACNCAKPSEEETARYCFLAYVKGDSCQVLYGSFHPDGNSAVKTLKPLVCDPEGDGLWSVMVYQKGDYESFSAYQFAGGNFTKNYEICF